MSSDDQHFLDILASIPTSVVTFTANGFDVVGRGLDSYSLSLRKTLNSSSWLPDSLKPDAPPEPVFYQAHTGYWHKFTDWVSRHRAITAAVVAFLGTGGALVYYQSHAQPQRRRAARAPNGARKEVVVIAGPPASPVTKSLMLDLDKRGFIVYVVVHTIEEEEIVKAEGVNRTDIRPFLIDLADTIKTEEALLRFQRLLSGRHRAFAGASAHDLSFSGLIIVPDLSYQTGPIETIAPEVWTDDFNTKVVGTIAMAQAFLPSICEFKARLLVLTPNVVASLKPAFHGIESTVVSALDGFTTTLRRELKTLDINVSQIRLGNFDFSHTGARHHLQTMSSSRTLQWPVNARKLYAQNFINQSRIAEGRGWFSGGENGSIAKATSPRQLHYAVFDALTRPRPKRVYRVGRGSLAYDLVGQWVPGGVVGWILGLRKVSLEEPLVTGPAPSLEDSFHAQAQTWEKVDEL